MTKILITGSKGQLASDLHQFLVLNSCNVVALPKEELDISNSDKVSNAISGLGVDWVINCAALTDLNLAELDEAKATQVNTKGAENVARSCRDSAVGLIHISTDAVFSSNTPKYFEVDDPGNPISRYGYSKMKGEEAIRGVLERHWILRSSWIYGSQGSKFFNSILSKFVKSHDVQVVDDQFGQPTSTNMICTSIHRIILGDVELGTHHIVPLEPASRYEFAIAIRQAYGKLLKRNCYSEVFPISSSHIDDIAPRSKYSLLRPSERAMGSLEKDSELVDEIGRVLSLREKAGIL